MRLYSAIFALAAVCAWGFHPAVLAYTFAAGERASATVTGCERSGRGPATCRGTWRTESGGTGRGEIYNLDADGAAGKTLPVRIGPLGPYANGWGRAWPGPAIYGVALLATLGIPARLLRRRTFRAGRDLAGELLARPGALIVSGGGSRRPDGTPHTTVRNLRQPPPGHRHLDLPGRTPRHGEWAGGLKSRLTSFQTLLDAGERPLMHLEHRSDMKFEPETVLLDPSGVPRLLVRREGGLQFRLLDPGGAPLGYARPDGRGPSAGLGLWAGERAVARSAMRGPEECVLLIEDDAPVAFRNAALALALIQTRSLY